MDTPIIRRRSFVGTGLAAAAGGALTPRPARASGHKWLNLVDPRDWLTGYSHMRTSSAGDNRGLWKNHSIIYGKAPGEAARPIMGAEGVLYVQHRWLDDERIEEITLEAGYYTDLKTGARLERWKNPFTGEILEPRTYRVVQDHLLTPTGFEGAELGRVTVRKKGVFEPAIHIGDRVWMSVHLTSIVEAQPVPDGEDQPVPRVNTAFARFTVLEADLQNPELEFVPASDSFNNITGWLYWLKMGDRPGLQTWHALSAKLPRFEELPQPFLSWLEREHPDLVSGEAFPQG